MFVPDEEAARRIEAWAAAAADPRAAVGIWPGWEPARQAVALALPASGGWCLSRFPGAAGRPVAARRGGTIAGVSCLTAAEATDLGFPGTPDPALADGEIPGMSARVVDGHAVLLVDAGTLVADIAVRMFGALFRVWWVGTGGSRLAAAVPPARTAAASALLTVEGRVLLTALTAGGQPTTPREGLVRAATQIALLRRERRTELAESEVDDERRMEAVLGMTQYVANTCARRLPSADGRDTGQLPADLQQELGDLGILPPSRRCLLEGWALALLLDRLHAPQSPGAADAPRPDHRPWAPRAVFTAGWKAALHGGAHLDALLEAHVRFDGGSRDDAALTAALAAHGHDLALRHARLVAAEAERARLALLHGILQGEGTLMVIDVGGLGQPRVDAPAPAEAVHGGVAVYPRGAAFAFGPGVRVRFDGLPVAADRRSGLLQARLQAKLRLDGDGTDLQGEDGAVFSDGLDVAVPGFRMHATTGTIRPIEGGYLVRLTQ